VSLLLEAGVDVNSLDHSNNSALAMAVNKGHCEVASILIENGAVTSNKNTKLQSPLLLACRTSHLKTIELLLKQKVTNF
jgi:ankyrin repeat protein